MSRYVIDKKLLDENIEIVKQKAGVPLIGVVKGNGYGFGIKEITKIMMRTTIQDSENKEKKYVYYVVIKTLN